MLVSLVLWALFRLIHRALKLTARHTDAVFLVAGRLSLVKIDAAQTSWVDRRLGLAVNRSSRATLVSFKYSSEVVVESLTPLKVLHF